MPSAVSPRSQERENILAAWLEIVWKHKWLMLSFLLLVLGATTVFTRRQTKIYRATAHMVIDLAAPRYLPQQGSEVASLGTGNSWNSEEYFETQYQIIRSRAVLSQVVELEGLARNLSFLGLDQIEDPERRARALERVDPIGLLQGRVQVEPIARSRVVLLHVRDKDPKQAARLANALAFSYRKYNWSTHNVIARRAVSWLKKQESELSKQRREAGKALRSFKREKGIFSASLKSKQDQLGFNLREAQTQLRKARQESARLRAEMEQIKDLSLGAVQSSVKEVLANGLVQRLKEQLVELQNHRTELLKRYLDNHPDVKVADRKIKRIRIAIDSEVKGIRTSIKREYYSTLKGEAEINAEVRKIQKEAADLLELEKEYQKRYSVLESSKLLHHQMSLRLKEAELQTEIDEEVNNVRILDEALEPTRPVSPRLFLNLLIASVLGLLGGIGLAFLIDQLDNTVKNLEFLESCSLTALGIIPSIQSVSRKEGPISNTDRFVLENPNSTVAETVRTIRTNLLFMAPEQKIRSIVVTSAGPREGKTSTCVNIGATMAMAGNRILLIDSDLRRPRMHKIFDYDNKRGLTDLIINPKAQVKDYARPCGIDNLDVLCSGPLPPNPSELLQTQGFRRALERLLEVYDRVIFDSPPVAAVTDAQILGMQLDGAILVVKAGQTTQEMLRKATRLLTDVNVNIFGGLLNNLNVSRRGYGGYYYRYYRSYGADESNESAES